MQHAAPKCAPSAAATARRRPCVGLIVLRSNTTCEAELQDVAGGRFSVHTARMKTVAGALAGDPQAAAFALMSELTRDSLLSEAAAMDLRGAEALMISCADLHSLDLLDWISARIGVPVLSSNQAFFEDVAQALATP